MVYESNDTILNCFQRAYDTINGVDNLDIYIYICMQHATHIQLYSIQNSISYSTYRLQMKRMNAMQLCAKYTLNIGLA